MASDIQPSAELAKPVRLPIKASVSCTATRLAVTPGQGNLDGADSVPGDRWWVVEWLPETDAAVSVFECHHLVGKSRRCWYWKSWERHIQQLSSRRNMTRCADTCRFDRSRSCGTRPAPATVKIRVRSYNDGLTLPADDVH